MHFRTRIHFKIASPKMHFKTAVFKIYLIKKILTDEHK